MSPSGHCRGNDCLYSVPQAGLPEPGLTDLWGRQTEWQELGDVAGYLHKTAVCGLARDVETLLDIQKLCPCYLGLFGF